MPHIIAVFNQKGGVGKTTTTINLAAYFAKTGKRVLVCDIDPQANSTSGLGIDKHSLNTTLYDLLISNEAVANSTIRAKKNIDVLPANPDLAGAEVQLVNLPEREFRLKKILTSLNYDLVLIDCPPSLGLLTVNALTAADDVLIPVQAEYYALEGLGQLLSVVQHVRQNLNPNINILGVVITMYDNRNALSGQVKEELKKHFEEKLLNTLIPRNVRLAEAPSFGKTIAEHDKWSKGARAYKALAKEVEERVYG